MSTVMTAAARRLRHALVASGAIVACQALALAVLSPRGKTLTSDLALTVAVGLSAWWAAGVAARGEVRNRHVAWLLAAGAALWTGAMLVWSWYEAVLGEVVPTDRLFDALYTTGAVVLLVAVVSRMAPLVDRTAAVRVLLDALMVGWSLFFIVFVVLGDEFGSEMATWRYPALDLVGATISLVVFTRVPHRSRVSWLVLTGSFVTLALADSSWAWVNTHGQFGLGNATDLLWTIGYLGLGLAVLTTAARQERPATAQQQRLVAARWEVLLPYGPVAAAFATAFYAHLVQSGFRGELVTMGLLLVVLLIVRHVVTVLENHRLARDLESRVLDRTAELQAREEHFRSVVQGMSDLVLVIDADHAIRYHTPALGPMLGFEDGSVIGSSALDLVHPDDLVHLAPARESIRGIADATAVAEVRLRRGDGTFLPTELRITNMLDVPAVRGHVVTVRDIRERKELEERLRHQAFYDSLTGLANRARLQARLEELVATGRRPALVLLDLDEFKSVNDTAGHELGDEVLVAVAERLLRCTRPGDVVSRLGGDEFAVLVDDHDSDGDASHAVARRVLAALEQPVQVRGRQVRCGGSIGVARVQADGDAGQVLRDADVAMYVAKANGKHRYELFNDDMHEQVVQRRALEDRLREAIATGGLLLHYQPLVELRSGGIVGVEALVRLPDGRGGLVPPMEFVPIAEETGLIGDLGGWVLRTACRQAADWQSLRPDGPPVQMSVNLSVRQLQDPDLCDLVASALEEAALPAQLLTLEITEGALGEDAGVDATLRCLRTLGVRLSIDDFGAGYSSLGRLRDFEVDELKIDRSFVGEISGPDTKAPIVAAVISMATSLGLDVVAEGIEHADQAAHLARGGCRVGQGYLFARPLPAGELAALLRADLTTTHSTSLSPLV